MDDDTLSLRQNLVNWLFTPLYLLLLFTTVTGYMAALKLSNQPYDQVMVERARLLASRFDLETGAFQPALERLFPEAGPYLRFALFDPEGGRVAGAGQLPRPRPVDLESYGPRLRDTQINGEKLRVLTLRIRSHRRAPGAEYVLMLAEPVAERLSLGRNILGNIVIPQFIFILIAGFAVWIGLRRGFAPLERLRGDLARRPSDDLRPLDTEMAPSEVRPLIQEVNALIERIRILIEQHKRFVADAAHQLRTPFAGLRAQAELAKREEAPPAVHEALERICLSAGRCSRLVNQLLTLARNEPAARQIDNFSLLDLDRVAQDATVHWVPEAVAKNIDLGYEGEGTQLPLRGDESALRDLMDNLLDNAIRYTPAGSRITLRTGYREGAWLSVEDDGPGIPPEHHRDIFERFYRPPGSPQGGSGLGLAIVREVAERHGGSVSIETGPEGRGTTFRVRFPHHGAWC